MHPVWLSFGGEGHRLGSSLGAAGASAGACFALAFSSASERLPRSQETAFGFRADRDLHCPLAHPECTPHPDLARGFASSRESLAACGGCFVRGRPPPLSLHAPRGRWCHPAHSRNMGPGDPGCGGNGSACPEAAHLRVAWACLPLCRPCLTHLPCLGMLCHHHLASGTSHP